MFIKLVTPQDSLAGAGNDGQPGETEASHLMEESSLSQQHLLDFRSV